MKSLKKDKRMHFFWTHKNLASWVSDEYLKQQKDRLPKHIYDRLHENRWTSGSGAFLTKKDVDAAVSRNLQNRFSGEKGLLYYMALDLGLRHDRTVIAACHQDPESGHVILDHLKSFEAPKGGGEVQIEDIEDHILELADQFRFKNISFDPWQSIRTRQRLESKGLRIEEFTFSGGNWVRLTQNLFSLFRDRRIKIFHHKELIKELLSVKIVEKSYGFRIDHDSGAHDDHVVALAMAAMVGAGEKARVTPGIRFVDSGSNPTDRPNKKKAERITADVPKPELKPGQQAIPVYEGDFIVRWDVIGGGPRPWLPGIR